MKIKNLLKEAKRIGKHLFNNNSYKRVEGERKHDIDYAIYQHNKIKTMTITKQQRKEA